MSISLQVGETFDAGHLAALSTLAEQARVHDGVAPFSDDLWALAASGRTRCTVRVLADDGELVGAGFSGDQGGRRAAEVVVAPAHRQRGHGGAIVDALLSATGGEQWLWSHGDHPGAAAIADRRRLLRARELLQLRRRLGPDSPALPRAAVPPDIQVRTFVPGHDEQAWVAVNAAAFSWHPEQGAVTVDDLDAAEAADWFDPQGFFLAERDDASLAGFHWTKVHERDPSPEPGTGDAPAIGEVYVVGVDPSAQAGGIGRALTIIGLEHLRDVRGLATVMLYVEGDNDAALKVYRRLGFRTHQVDVAYRRA